MGVDPKIINLSNKEISYTEIKLLQRGLKFTPTPNVNTTQLREDIQEFCRKLKLRELFADKHTDDESIVKNRSTFIPPKGREIDLDNYVEHLTTFPLTQKNDDKGVNSNLTIKEKRSIDTLQRDTDIIIKEADKGGAIVIMDINYYKEKMEEQLMNSQYYSEIPENADSKTIKKIKKND